MKIQNQDQMDKLLVIWKNISSKVTSVELNIDKRYEMLSGIIYSDRWLTKIDLSVGRKEHNLIKVVGRKTKYNSYIEDMKSRNS